MSSPSPSFSSAFRLGRVLEELASISRKQVAIRTIKSVNPDFGDEQILGITESETRLTSESVFSLCDTFLPYLPGQFLHHLQKLDDSDPTGRGLMDTQQINTTHEAIAGIIEESIVRKTVWNCIQTGRFSQRSWLVISNIWDTLKGHTKMPGNPTLAYLCLRTDNPAPDLNEGTHLWNVHKVFNDILKNQNFPKSLASSLNRLGDHIPLLPMPEALKKDQESIIMTLNRISNDLSFVDIHEMIGDDPEDHLGRIMDFFERHQRETDKLNGLIRSYLESFETYLEELSEDEIFTFEV